jgi:uncharacterized membrane protein YdjX (TVP38/TMEM64 family)
MVEPRSPIGAALRGAGFAVSLVALAAAAEWLATAGLLSQHWIDVAVAGRGLVGALSFLAVGTVATALGLPRQVIAFLGGYAFGAVVGTELALAAAIFGCVATFGYARLAATTLVARRFATHVQRLDAVLNAAPFHMTLVVRLLPVGSNLLTNLVAGVTRVRFGPFVAGSAVGYLPQTLAFALAGSGIRVAPALNFALAGVLLAVSAIVGIRLYRRHRDAAAVEDALAPHGPPAETA